MVVPVLTLMTIVNCAVILVLVVNIGRKVNMLEQRMMLFQDSVAASADQPVQDSELPELSEPLEVADIDGNIVDASEAAEIGRAHV